MPASSSEGLLLSDSAAGDVASRGSAAARTLSLSKSSVKKKKDKSHYLDLPLSTTSAPWLLSIENMFELQFVREIASRLFSMPFFPAKTLLGLNGIG